MPLIIEPRDWTTGQLREQATRLRDGLVELAEHFDRLSDPVANPWALEYGLSLVRRSVDLATDILSSEDSEATRLAHVVNQLYEVGNSMPVFLKFAEAPPPPVPARRPRTT